MSAVPKKKLCWHCEGSIDRNIDNCPFCGVYIHAPESDEDDSWNPQFTLKVLSKKDDPVEEDQIASNELPQQENASIAQSFPFEEIKKEVLPMLLLFLGSCFFLFGSVLLLFSHEGTLTLQWKSEYALYFLLVGIPSLFLGFFYLGNSEK